MNILGWGINHERYSNVMLPTRNAHDLFPNVIIVSKTKLDRTIFCRSKLLINTKYIFCSNILLNVRNIEIGLKFEL